MRFSDVHVRAQTLEQLDRGMLDVADAVDHSFADQPFVVHFFVVAQVLQPKPPRSLCVNVRVRVPQFVQHFHHFKLTNNVQKKRVSLGPTRPCIQTSQKQKSKDILGYKAPK